MTPFRRHVAGGHDAAAGGGVTAARQLVHLRAERCYADTRHRRRDAGAATFCCRASCFAPVGIGTLNTQSAPVGVHLVSIECATSTAEKHSVFCAVAGGPEPVAQAVWRGGRSAAPALQHHTSLMYALRRPLGARHCHLRRRRSHGAAAAAARTSPPKHVAPETGAHAAAQSERQWRHQTAAALPLHSRPRWRLCRRQRGCEGKHGRASDGCGACHPRAPPGASSFTSGPGPVPAKHSCRPTEPPSRGAGRASAHAKRELPRNPSYFASPIVGAPVLVAACVRSSLCTRRPLRLGTFHARRIIVSMRRFSFCLCPRGSVSGLACAWGSTHLRAPLPSPPRIQDGLLCAGCSVLSSSQAAC